MPFDEDLSAFFSSSEFAHVATWTPLGGAPVTANVMFDMPTEDVLGGRAISNEYLATLPATYFPGIDRKAEVTIGSDTYSVREVKLLDDGKLKTLALTKQ